MNVSREQSAIEVGDGISIRGRDTKSVDPAIIVWYDGSCPLCRREISVYQGQRSSKPIVWLDVSNDQYAIPAGFDRVELLKRFHVQSPSGQVASGAAAFVSIWSELPGWRNLARLAKRPGGLGQMEWAY